MRCDRGSADGRAIYRCAWERGDATSHDCRHNAHGLCERDPEQCACTCHPEPDPELVPRRALARDHAKHARAYRRANGIPDAGRP